MSPEFIDIIRTMAWVFGALLLAGIGFPIPEEIPTVFAGIWVANNPELGWERWLILPVCFLGVIFSDVMLYSIGRMWGPRLLAYRWAARIVPPDKREKIEYNFSHYGTKVLLFIRWVPAIRSPMFITAGIMRVPVLKFVLADGTAAILGHSLLFFLAWWFGDVFKSMIDRAENTIDAYIRPVLILTAIVGIAVYLFIHFLRRPVSTADPTELPLIGERVAATIDSMDASRHDNPPPAPPPGANGPAAAGGEGQGLNPTHKA